MSRTRVASRGCTIALASAIIAMLACATADAPSSRPLGHTPRHAPVTSKSQPNTPQVRRLDAPGWVEVATEVLASDDEAPARARERALRMARQAAVEFVAGVQVQSGLLSLEQVRGDEQTSLIQALTATRSDALVIDEELRDSRVRVLPGGGYRLSLTLRLRVLDHGRGSDERFRTEAELNRHHFREGEAVQLSVRVNQDARLYVVGVSDAGAVLLLPNRYLRDTRVEAGRRLQFPDHEMRERGVRLEARLPEGKSTSREALIVVALRGDRRLQDLFPAAGETFRMAEADAAPQLLNDVLAPLLEIPARDWTFDQLVYSIGDR